jgi:glycosyltransferase involved in cell wall biosynthesis
MSVIEIKPGLSTLHPDISVILPAYNCAAYLQEAVQSILNQTFSNFELVIINDGSTDNTESIILSFTDNRIVYVKNEENKGLVYTLNRGIHMARGKYIARMDSDDICFPERLVKQKIFLDENKMIASVASTVIFIDENGAQKGLWELDQKTITAQQIRKTLPYQNCIAHPSIMLRTEIAMQFCYKEYQKNIEDYDLWLRLYNNGYSIEKIKEPQLYYRVHSASVTGVYLKSKNFFLTHFEMKRKFLFCEVKAGKINSFTLIVFWAALADAAKGFFKPVKQLLNRRNV